MATILTKPVLTGHTAGIFADMTLDGPEIGTLVAVVDRAKNLPNRRTMGKQDPYCAMRLGKEAKKTDTDRRGGQTPKWDQELRFTVHDSPDYYRLKCSVFNDDKKTDLIGEAWISLVEIVKPGGGSNDLWHQLNYKGKYAGDIRVELTYYDRRPREEKISEKKKLREKISATNGDAAGAVTGPRQLGPREVRRRPLPASPGAGTPISRSPAQTPPASVPQPEAPARPPKLPIDHNEDVYTQPPIERYEELQLIPTTIDPTPPSQLSLQHYRQPFCEDQTSSTDYQDEPLWDLQYTEQPQHHQSPSSSMMPSPSSLPPSWPGEMEEWNHSDRQTSQEYRDSDTDHFAMSRAPAIPPGKSTEPYYQSPRSNTSPVRPIPYRDSPLRQSMNHADTAMQHFEEPETYDAPPPPPMHRDTPPRRRLQEYPPSSFPHNEQSIVPFGNQPINSAPRRVSFEEQSPLQRIEQQYFTQQSPDASFRRPSSREFTRDSYVENETNRYDDLSAHSHHTPERHHSYDEYQSHVPPNFASDGRRSDILNDSPYEQSWNRPAHRESRGSHDGRRLSGNLDSFEDQYAMIPHSNTQTNPMQSGYRKPEPVRPRPQPGNSSQRPQRKEVSPGPYPTQDGRRLSAVPFGPDAYDVLNPSSSPVTNDGTMFQTPPQAKESARMKEVEKLRDQGPIIGNDGRVIDPSDHLPSDTWAPEPERKQRRPEHVIHYRSKNDSRTRGQSHPTPMPTQTDRHSQISPPGTSHSSPPAAPSTNIRNKLQKPASARPLPTQPYPQQLTEPARGVGADRSPILEPSSRQAIQRYSSHDPSPSTQRPTLSEYQVPASNSYTPRGSMYQDDFYQTSQKSQMQTGREYNPRNSNFYDDPLTAELSMIDIGPSRGQMVLSGRRDY